MAHRTAALAVSHHQLTGFGWDTRMIPPSCGILWAQVHRNRTLHLGNVNVPPCHPAIEGSEDGGGRQAAFGRKGAVHDFIIYLCTSGKKGTRAGRGHEPEPMPRNQLSRREGSGLGSVHTSSPMLTAARENMAINSGSDLAVATTPEGASPAESSSSEDDSYRHLILYRRAKLNSGHSRINGEPHRKAAVVEVRGLQGLAWRRGSHCGLQFAKSTG